MMRAYARAWALVMSTGIQAGPIAALAIVMLSIAQTIAAPFFSVAAGNLVDATTTHDQGRTVAAGLILAACVGGRWALGGVATHITVRLQRKVAFLLDCRLIAGDSRLLGLEHHEQAAYLAQLDLLRNSYWQVGFALSSAVQAVALAVQWVTTTAILLHVQPLLGVLPLCGLPSLIAAARVQRRMQTANEGIVEHVRREAHLFDLGTSASAGKEVRVYGLGDTLAERRRAEADIVVNARHRVRLAGIRLQLAGQLIFTVGYLGAIIVVVLRARDGLASPGDIVVVAGLAGQVRGLVGESAGIVTNILSILQVIDRILWLEHYATTKQSRGTSVAAPARLKQGISLEGVSFRYPGAGHDVLEKVDIHFPAGATVALVGDNGSGKSTLVKLLCRFYEPASGRMTVDGIDVRDIGVAEWHTRLAGAFQDYSRLELIAREAVGVGDVAVLEGEGDVAVTEALDRAGARDVLAALPSNLATMLGARWQGGVELSGGQWQKLALGRARMRTQPLLLVLDEPTAALDPASEHALFERFAGAAREVRENGGVTLLISHRFSTVHMADLIIVIAGGHVQEMGSHHELMARRGLYAELYSLQAAAYAATPSLSPEQ